MLAIYDKCGIIVVVELYIREVIVDAIYIRVANKVAATMREDKKDFTTAFNEVMRNYSLDLEITKKHVGSILGKRKKSRPKKVSELQLNLPLELPSVKYKDDAARCEASLIKGIPKHDL